MEAGWNVDLHTHTCHSPDATTRPLELVERARAAGLDRVAVTDHGTIEGALRAREQDPDLVIVGEEIRCRCRAELIGLFLRERIPMRLPLEEVAARIRDQGGIVYAPHPYAYARSPRARAHRVLEVADVVEACNARAFLPPWNRLATRAARERGLAMGAGSDAHFPFELGRAWARVRPFRSPTEFRLAMLDSEIVWNVRSHPALHAASLVVKLSSGARRPGQARRLPSGAPRPVPADAWPLRAGGSAAGQPRTGTIG